jgi:hypothetical protein
MKTKFNLALVLALGLALSGGVHADDDDVTLDVVELDQTPADIVNLIELPESASDQARDSSAHGLETANQARELRGNETAAEARELGREFGERMAEEARDGNVSEQIRDEALDRAADHRPEVPGRP